MTATRPPSPGRPAAGRTRPYHSPQRRARADERRRHVYAVAHDLFVSRGWAATTVSEVARAADVSPQLIFSTMGGKSGLLLGALRHRSFGGPDLRSALEAVPFEQQPDVGSRLDLLADFVARSVPPMGPILSVLLVAADADPATRQLLHDVQQLRRETGRLLLPRLVGRRVRGSADLADELYVMTSGETYLQFARVNGWTDARYRRWVRTSLRDLFARYGVALDSPDGR